MGYIRKILSWSLLSHILYLAFLIGIIVFTIFGDSGLYQLHSLYKTKEKLTYHIKENQAKINLLENEKVRLTNPDYLESIIRKELGYIKKGEVVYQVTP